MRKLPRSTFKGYNFIKAENSLDRVLIYDLTKKDRGSLWLINGYYLYNGYYGSPGFKHPLITPQIQAWEGILNDRVGMPKKFFKRPASLRIRLRKHPIINNKSEKPPRKKYLMKIVYLSFDKFNKVK